MSASARINGDRPGAAPDHEVVIVGSGFAGLGTAIELRRQGISDDFVVLERAATLGGTWRDNRYPGCACDVPAPLYSFSFAPNPDWSRMFAPHDEIRRYLERCADRFGVRERLRFETEVTAAAWDEGSQLWRLEVRRSGAKPSSAAVEAPGVNGSESLTARVLVLGAGGLNRPRMPVVEGLERFTGPVFHSAEWDDGTELAGKRVGVVGTGASAIQIVPQLARDPRTAVTVFQRTPPWVLPKPERRFSALERRLFRALPPIQRALRAAIWGAQESIAIGNVYEPAFNRPLEAVGRRFIRRYIRDPELAEALTPDYRIGCKRLLVANDYYPALAKPNVEVVGEGIVRATERSVVTASGHEVELDALVLATGFHAADPFEQTELRGRGGVALTDAWADGLAAYLGTTIAGFPNMFVVVGPNTGTGHTSQVYMIESQIRYVLDALRTMRRERLGSVDVRPEVEVEFNREVQRRMRRTVWTRGGCHSWYLDERGHNVTLWPGFSFDFRRRTRRFDLESYATRPAEAPNTLDGWQPTPASGSSKQPVT